MAKFSLIYNKMSRGEVSEKSLGLHDIPEISRASLRTCENFILSRQGQPYYRSGFKYFKNPTDDGGGGAIASGTLIPFIFSKTEAYVVMIQGTDIIVYRNDGTKATVTGSAALLANDATIVDWAQSADVLYILSGNYKPAVLTRTAADTFTIENFDDPPSTVTDPEKFTTLRYPFRPANTTTTTLAPQDNTGSQVAWSGVNVGDAGRLVSSASLFDADQSDGLYRIAGQSGEEAVFEVTSYVSSTRLDGNWIVVPSAGNMTTGSDWSESSWSNFRGWPTSIAIFEERLLMAGNTAQPDTFWGSLVGNFRHFMQTVLDQDASSDSSGLLFFGTSDDTFPVEYTLASNEVNPIQWLSPGRGTLAIGTLGQEYRVTGGEGRIITPTSISITPQTAHGSSGVNPVRVGQTTIFVQRDGTRLRELNFDFETNADFATDLNHLSDHISRHGEENIDFEDFASATGYQNIQFSQLVYDKTRGIVWGYNTRGQLMGLTINSEGQVAGWHRHYIGGYLDSGTSGDLPIVDAMAMIPNENGTADELYIGVNRTIDSGSEWFIEKMNPDFEVTTLNTDSLNDDDYPYFLDSSERVTNSPASASVTGLSRLANETVSIIADGKVHPDATVSAGGAITLNYSASEIIVGYGYTGKLRYPTIEDGGSVGVAHGTKRRAQDQSIKVFRSFYLKYGWSRWNGNAFTDTLFEKSLYLPGQSLGTDPQLVSKWIENLKANSDLGEDCYYMIQQDLPLPLYIAAVVIRGQTNG